MTVKTFRDFLKLLPDNMVVDFYDEFIGFESTHNFYELWDDSILRKELDCQNHAGVYQQIGHISDTAAMHKEFGEYTMTRKKNDYVYDEHICYELCNTCVKQRRYNSPSTWRLKHKHEGGRFCWIAANTSICQSCYEKLEEVPHETTTDKTNNTWT